MDAESSIRSYGYAAIVVGTVFEGEATMLAAGAAVRGGLLQPEWVCAAGMLGTFISDTFCFWVGRITGTRLARWFPKLFSRVDEGFRMIARHHDKLIVFFQFVPGMCTITPLAFGMSRIAAPRFMALNLIGIVLWTTSYAVLGYGIGAVWQLLSNSTSKWPLALAAIAILIGATRWTILRSRRFKTQLLGEQIVTGAKRTDL